MKRLLTISALAASVLVTGFSNTAFASPYGGITGGANFPNGDSGESLGVGGGLSAFGGYQLTDNVGVDLEVIANFNGEDTDLQNLTGATFSSENVAVMVNPRFSTDKFGVELFVSPGIGYLWRNVGNDNTLSLNPDLEEDGAAYQIKGGVGIPVTNNVNLLVQGRYLNDFGDGSGVTSVEAGTLIRF